MSHVRDAYLVLQVDPSAEQAVVHAAYRALARCYHPDGDRPDERRMIELNAAYERVKTPEARGRYDAERRRPVAVGPGPAAGAGGAAGRAQPPSYDPWAERNAAASVAATDVLDFGRYAGWRIADLARHDPDYLRWLSRHSTGVRFLDVIARHLPGEPLGRRTSYIGR